MYIYRIKSIVSLRVSAIFAIIMLLGYLPLFSQNTIIIENALTGSPPSEWDISGEDYGIQGFATELGVNKGGIVNFKINVPSQEQFMIRIYRLGYYQGLGARLKDSLGPIQGTSQTGTRDDLNTGKIDCENWSISAHWDIPADAVSGIYIAKMITTSGHENHITFIVRDDDRNSPLLYVTADGTWQAYNTWGGRSFYLGEIDGTLGYFDHAVKLSYQRPFITRGIPQNYYRIAELPMIRWMERNGYDVSYTTQLDMSRNASINITPEKHKVLISCGHDEYWSAECRTNWETARNNGVNLCFLSGNEIYWKTRWEDDMKTLVCFKEGNLGEHRCDSKCDISTDTWTGLWRTGTPSEYPLYPNIDGGKPENQLSGQISWMGTLGTITVPETFKNLRFWKNTAVADLKPGETMRLAEGTLGTEWDPYTEVYPYPAQRVLLSATQFSGQTHNLSLYRHSSGALVFGAGTIHWSWGLDGVHDGGPSIENKSQQQAMVNLFAYMGVPATQNQLQAGLIAEPGTYSTTPPTTIITSPVNGAAMSSSTVTITGTTTVPNDAVIAGIEISTDGGTTWNPASGTGNWTFAWNPISQGTYIIKARAWDDLGNVEIPGLAPVNFSSCISVTFNGSTAYYSVFKPNEEPGAIIPPTGVGTDPLEIGMRFESSLAGYITSLKYYKKSGFTGLHIGNLWTNTGTGTGTLLATAVYSNETASGWQTVTLPQPISITAGTPYIVSVFSPYGYFVKTEPYFQVDKVNYPLTANANNGLYYYGGNSNFPDKGPTLSNYWVDVTFATTNAPDITPPSVITISPIGNAINIPVNVHPTVTFGEAVNSSTVNSNTFILTSPEGTSVSGTVSFSTETNTSTFTPELSLAVSTTYTAKIVGGTVGIKDLSGNALSADYSWVFKTASPSIPSVTVHPLTQSTCAGNTVSFSSTATGTPAPTVQWQVLAYGGNTWSDISGATSSPYSFTNVLADNNNQYRAVWTNQSGTVTSGAATLTVSDGLSGTIGAVNANICKGEPFQLKLNTASGQPPYTLVVNGKTYSGVNSGASFATIPTADENIWDSSLIPYDYNADPDPKELGVKFIATANGFIKGIRFYKVISDLGSHVGHLWTAEGNQLATATFSNETASGWQQVLFSSPVGVTANTTYVASYSNPSGIFSKSENYFVSNLPVTSNNGLLQTVPGTESSVYNNTVGGFPNLVPSSLTNYWVDVVYAYSIESSAVTNNLTSISFNGTCATVVNPPNSVAINFNDPSAPGVSSPVNYNEGAQAVPLTATGTNLMWYTAPAGGTGTSTAPTPSTYLTGTTSYYVSQSNNGCEGPRAQINVVVSAILSDWYSQNWKFRRPAAINNSCGTLTDYQVLITLDNTFDFTKPKSDGSDIRVTNINGTSLIPYWIETWDVAAKLARIWIKMPSIPTGGTTAYLYYGNPAAPSLSNGNSTFILFDDTWDSNWWTKTGSPAVNNGIISFSYGQSIQSPPGNTFLPGNALGIKANFKGSNTGYKWAGFIDGDNSPFTVLEVDPTNTAIFILANQTSDGKNTKSLGTINDAFHVYELGWLSDETIAYADHSATPVASIAATVPTSPLPIGFNNYSDATYALDVDWIYLRKFGSCTPSALIGNEQYITSNWTGANSSDWSNSSNWSAGLPLNTKNAFIPSAPTNQPHVTASTTSPSQCNNLTIEAGAIVIIDPGKALTVNGLLTNNAGTAGLVIKSDHTGTGSLIHTTVNVEGTVERYVNNADWTNWKDGWHFLSSPVEALPVSSSDFITAPYDLYCWYEPGNEWVNYKATSGTYWSTANTIFNGLSGNSNNFQVGKGYLVAYDEATAKSFTGKLNVGNVPVTNLTITGNTLKYRSWHLLGNPFSSAISWSTSWLADNSNSIGGIAKIWDEENQGYIDLDANSGNAVIPVSNGFMVQATYGTGWLTIPSGARTHQAQIWYKSADKRLILIARNLDNPSAQESVVNFNPSATDGYDIRYDGEFLAGYAPLFYSVVGSMNLSTNSLPALTNETSIPFSFIKNEGYSYSIEAKGGSNLQTEVWLLDKKANIDHNFSVENIYNFTAFDSDKADRFTLHFGTEYLGVNQEKRNESFAIWYNEGAIHLSSQSEKILALSIIDMTGRELKNLGKPASNIIPVGKKLAMGYYLVKITTTNSVVVKKIFIN